MTAEDESRRAWELMAGYTAPPEGEKGRDLTLEMMQRATQQLEELGRLNRKRHVFKRVICRMRDGRMEWVPDTWWNRHGLTLVRIASVAWHAFVVAQLWTHAVMEVTR